MNPQQNEQLDQDHTQMPDFNSFWESAWEWTVRHMHNVPKQEDTEDVTDES